MSNNEKISNFTSVTNFQSGDVLTGVRGNTNVNFTYSGLFNSLSGLGSFKSVGGGSPILNQPVAGVNQIRTVEGGNGVNVALSATGGVKVSWNVSQDATGTSLTSGLNTSVPVVSSLVAGAGIEIDKEDDVITITSEVDPSTGLSNRVVVKSASDLAGALDSTKQYFIDGAVDMGSQQITPPEGGLTFDGYGTDISVLYSSAANYTMFNSGASGNIVGTNCTITTSGANSKVYNLTSNTGNEAVELTNVNYTNCSSLGELNGFRQGLEVNTARFGGSPQLTLTGSWSGGFFIGTSIVRNLTDGTYSLFKAGAGLTFDSRFRINQNIDLPANASFLDFEESNFNSPSTLQLDGCIVTREGVSNSNDSNLTPNITAGNIVCSWKSNNGLPNTFVGGVNTISTEVATVVSATSTYYDLAGTYTTSNLQHFDSPANGQLRHLGNNPREFKVIADLAIDSGANNDLKVKVVKYDASTTSFVDVLEQARQVNSLSGGRDVAFFTIFTYVELDQNDYVKLQVENNTNTDNVTAELDSFFIVEER